jgi:site-specific recombinase XerD
MSIDTCLASKDGPPLHLLDTHVESFLRHLRAAGYAERTLRKKRSIAASFARWTRRAQVAVEQLDESHITAFVERSPRRRKTRMRFELAALRPFLRYLRAEAGVAIPLLGIDNSAAHDLERGYTDYLRNERGLTENSLRVYVPFIRAFLSQQVTRTGCVCPGAFDALTVRAFLLDHIHNRSSEYARLLATALRSFLRFLYLRGETAIDLPLAVPPVRRWRQAAVPAFLSPEEVERVLSATDRSTPRGRRDHAILLLLARLGLRAGEVVALELGDLQWRTGEIVVRGKGRVRDRLPLLAEVGEALALYLRQDRGASASRRVFLRTLAPRVGLAGPGGVGHIVRRALARAGLRSARRGAAHLFRHSLATRMIRHGASLAEIAEVLRHRSQGTTALYAKVAFEALRGVARPWPGTGGAR